MSSALRLADSLVARLADIADRTPGAGTQRLALAALDSAMNIRAALEHDSRNPVGAIEAAAVALRPLLLTSAVDAETAESISDDLRRLRDLSAETVDPAQSWISIGHSGVVMLETDCGPTLFGLDEED